VDCAVLLSFCEALPVMDGVLRQSLSPDVQATAAGTPIQAIGAKAACDCLSLDPPKMIEAPTAV
jgi:hypothetical protein